MYFMYSETRNTEVLLNGNRPPKIKIVHICLGICIVVKCSISYDVCIFFYVGSHSFRCQL